MAWAGGLYALPIAFLAIFFFHPLGNILGYSLFPAGQPDLSGFLTLVVSGYYRQTLLFTLWQAALSTLFTLLLAIPSAYVLGRYQFWGRGVLLALAALPFILPTVIVAVGLQALLGERGLLNEVLMALFALEEGPLRLERSLPMILIAHVFYNYGLAVRLLASYGAALSVRYEEAARILGLSGWALWWRVTLPLLRPALGGVALLVFIFNMTSFGVVVILGGVRFATLEVQIYYQAVNLFNLPLAAALSLVQMVLALLAFWLYGRWQRGAFPIQTQSEALLRSPRHWGARLAIVSLGLLIVVGVGSPLLALVWRSLHGRAGFGLQNYLALLGDAGGLWAVPLWVGVANSLIFAGGAVLLAVGLGLVAAHLLRHGGRWLDGLFMLPLATSAVTLGLGYTLSFDQAPLNLRASWVVLPILHALVALPFVVRSVLPSLRAIPPNWLAAAATLGAGPLARWWRIERPLTARAAGVGALFAFTVSLGEFGASLFVARPNVPTLPTMIYRLLGQPSRESYGQALALSVILLLLCLLAFAALERLRRAAGSDF